MSDCVGQNLVQTGKDQTPGVRAAGSGQVGLKPTFLTHEVTECMELGVGGDICSQRS
jgi:hypothetical protein